MDSGYALSDPSKSLLRLRQDVIILPQLHGEKIYYYIESPTQSRFFRIGHPEYVFLSLLDGKTSFAEALALTSRALGPQAISQVQAKEVCDWLVEQRLAEVATVLANSHEAIPSKPWWTHFNPFWIKIPFGSPDRLVESWSPLFDKLFSPLAIVIGITTILLTFLSVWGHRSDLMRDLHQIILPNNWFRLGAIWLLLKLVHEAGHAFACKKLGGSVRDCGMVMILFAPLAYVDVTSAWRFASRAHRIGVATAGIYFEMLVASAAAIGWLSLDSREWSPWLCSIMVSATVTTVLFNINPLMRFDGYFMLSDFVAVPNLYQRGQQQAADLWRRILWGISSRGMRRIGFASRLITLYGAAAFAWRTAMTVIMVLAASIMFSGAGFYLSLFAVALWLVKPTLGHLQKLHQRYVEAPHSLIRGFLISSCGIVALVSAVAVIPWPGPIVAPAIVDFSDECVVRTRVSGFVAKVCVRDGDQVRAGQVLVELENPQIVYQLAEIEERIDAEESAQRSSLDEQRPADAQVSQRNLEAFRLRRDELKKDLEALQVRSQVNGHVITRNLDRKIGTYAQRGTELMTIEDPSRKELLVSLSSEQVDALGQSQLRNVRFFAGPEVMVCGKLMRIEPRATVSLPHPALSAVAGGALAVKASSGEQESAHEELIEPRVLATVELDPTVSEQVLSGQRGNAHLGIQSRTLLERWWQPLIRWLDQYRV